MRSEILQPRDLEYRKLGGPLRLQKLYSSTQQGRAAFFEYLREATQNFERRLLVIKVRAVLIRHFSQLKGCFRRTTGSLSEYSFVGQLLGTVTLVNLFLV